MSNFLSKTATGITVLLQAITQSSGSSDSNKIIATDDSGKVDVSFIPDSVGKVTTTGSAVVALVAGDFVAFNATGDVVKADKGAISTAAKGFVLENVAAGNIATVYLYGVNTAIAAIANQVYFLNTQGGTSQTPPAFDNGSICQQLGYGTPLGLLFEYNEPIEFNNQ